jgi:hypothetical protein
MTCVAASIMTFLASIGADLEAKVRFTMGWIQRSGSLIDQQIVRDSVWCQTASSDIKICAVDHEQKSKREI